MSSPAPISLLPTQQPPTPPTVNYVGSRGTLHYTKGGLYILFVWLLCNDLCLMLMEQVAPQLTPLLLKDHGASNKDIALYMSTLAGVFTIWINPVVSTWSDRYRSPFGRRRPFLFFAAPICAVLLALIPFAPRLAVFFGLSASSGTVMMIGICFLLYSVFNSVILAIFTYYFWDVVPEPFLGRFSALVKIASTLVQFVWQYVFFGLAEKHTEEIFVGIAIFFAVVYLVSLWRVKEGEYPAPEEPKSKSVIAPIRAYFIECYSQPYFLWFYAAMAAFQIGNLSNIFQIFFLRDTLGMNLTTIGQMRAWPSLAVIALAYPMGSLIDRLNPVRMVAPAMLLSALSSFFGFFFLQGPWTLFVYASLSVIANFAFGIAYGVTNVAVFPREKIGQFCSATTATYQVLCFIIAVPMGMLFDYMKDYRYVYLWWAVFQVLSAVLYVKVYRNWKEAKGHPPVPQAM